MIKKILLQTLCLAILMVPVLTMPLFVPTGLFVYIRLGLLMLILIQGLVLFKTVVIDHPVGRITANVITVCFSVFVIFVLLEAIFMFYPRSHGANYTLASRLWYAKYWKPVNAFGFRDDEPDHRERVILFVGDSYAAGSGLTSVEDRFSNIVRRALRKRNKPYTVINIGRLNLDSREEYQLMVDFSRLTGIKPERIVLQYYGNDIGGTAIERGMNFSCFNPVKMDKYLVMSSTSYLLNFLYHSFAVKDHYESYLSCLDQAYSDSEILSKHEEDLGMFIKYARKHSAKLMVVIFPLLTDVERSDSMYGNIISNFFKANRVSVINVSPLIKNLPISERIINKNDLHASKKVNEIVAREILKILDKDE